MRLLTPVPLRLSGIHRSSRMTQSHPDAPSSSTSFSKTRTLSVLVENSPGVLARVSSLFSRRGYNIDSLAVGPTENPNFSRMTIVINVEDHALEQVVAQLDKLINVISITELDPVISVQRELLLVKVSTDEKTRSQVLETVQLFRAKVVDVAQDAVTIEATGNTEKISALLRVLEPFGILELIQSGLVAMSRGLKPGSISEDER
jgi:acetolactate synthase I/III small subunit